MYLEFDFTWYLILFFQVEMKGISGPIEFKEGRRIQFKLDLLKLNQHSLVKVRNAAAFASPLLSTLSLSFKNSI